MSEIRSISEGTFVLGDTNNLVFEAGSGIKIDSPSEGTVRIANDETVLYDNSNPHNVSTDAEFQMSESIWNFERVFIDFENMEFNVQNVTMLLDLKYLTSGSKLYTPMMNGNSFPLLNIPYANFNINSAGNIKYLDRGLLYNNWTSPLQTTGENRGYRVRRVIGINRISGGNNE